MRLKFIQTIGLFLILINVIVVYYVWRVFVAFHLNISLGVKESLNKPVVEGLDKLVTVVIRDFDFYENDVSATIRSFLNVVPSLQVLVLCDGLPYPPLDILQTDNSSQNIKVLNLQASLDTSYVHQYFLNHIQTKYILFVPDSVRLPNKQILRFIVDEISRESNAILAIPLNNADLTCIKIFYDLRRWLLSYNTTKSNVCDAVDGKHLVLIEYSIAAKLSNAQLLPFPWSLYLQTAFLNYRAKILQGITIHEGKPIIKSHHAQLMKQQDNEVNLRNLYKVFNLKKIYANNTVHWYGCNRNTSRCFPTVLNTVPLYIYEGKWTPPCCLENLRKTALHVFNSLDEAGVRYWLESGSLLGAMRMSDILPWDYDVDVGFNRDDINRCPWLVKARNRPVVDTRGFLWERATESNFFRVYFSRKNQIHVNLLPFYPRNGTMAKDSWFTNHMNMDFPDHFLHPMSSIEFIGRHVPSPNNIRDFLEMKFGKGSIEYPRYPDPSIKFP